MRNLLLILPMLCLAACGVKPPMPGLIPTAPVHAVEVAPAVATVRADAVKSFVVAQRLENQVGELQTSATTLQGALAKSYVEAGRLRDAKSATEKDLDGLYMELGDAKALTQGLVEETATAHATAEEQAVLRVKAEADLEVLEATAAKKDAEAAMLRTQNTDLGGVVARLNANVEGMAKARDAAMKEAAVGGYLKGWVLALGIGLFVAIVGLVYVKFFLRPI